MKNLDRFSDVHLPDRLHNQLNRLVQFANENTSEQENILASHTSDIATLKKQIAALTAQLNALQTN